MTLLVGAFVVTPAEQHEPGWVRVKDERIIAVGPADPPSARLGESVIDLTGKWLVPGFVDLHVHGGGGASHEDEDPRGSRAVVTFHRRHGTTTTLASLMTSAPSDLVRRVRALADLCDEGDIAGIHLEGPWLARKRCGAHDAQQLREPDLVELDALLQTGRGHVRQITIAPELPGALELTRRVVDAGVIAAVGHTDATYADARAVFDAGASLATHLYNGMRPMHHREPGPVLAALEDERVTIELIADGVHLHDAVIAATFAQSGGDRVALVTDAISAAGSPDGDYRLGSISVRVTDGVARTTDGSSLAGSTLTQDEALRRIVFDCGLPLPEAVSALSVTPARTLGLEDRVGSIAQGLRADLVVLDNDLQVHSIMAGGSWVDGRSP
jgi:N-acetylglucosamine-6-phosphate deacetylase